MSPLIKLTPPEPKVPGSLRFNRGESGKNWPPKSLHFLTMNVPRPCQGLIARGELAMPYYNTGHTAIGAWSHGSQRMRKPWRSWYKSPIWKSIRRHRLAEEPHCRQCALEGRTVVASHVDHIKPHLGEWLLFVQYDNTESLCPNHHNAHKRSCQMREIEPGGGRKRYMPAAERDLVLSCLDVGRRN
jgi:5-methylcytosine-specific restriction protein A